MYKTEKEYFYFLRAPYREGKRKIIAVACASISLKNEIPVYSQIPMVGTKVKTLGEKDLVRNLLNEIPGFYILGEEENYLYYARGDWGRWFEGILEDARKLDMKFLFSHLVFDPYRIYPTMTGSRVLPSHFERVSPLQAAILYLRLQKPVPTEVIERLRELRGEVGNKRLLAPFDSENLRAVLSTPIILHLEGRIFLVKVLETLLQEEEGEKEEEKERWEIW